MPTEESRRTLAAAQRRTRRKSEHGEITALATLPSREEIERRAYELYLARGGTPGHELEDWLRAEHELLRDHKRP
jgi:hypothetical protein